MPAEDFQEQMVECISHLRLLKKLNPHSIAWRDARLVIDTVPVTQETLYFENFFALDAMRATRERFDVLQRGFCCSRRKLGGG